MAFKVSSIADESVGITVSAYRSAGIKSFVNSSGGKIKVSTSSPFKAAIKDFATCPNQPTELVVNL